MSKVIKAPFAQTNGEQKTVIHIRKMTDDTPPVHSDHQEDASQHVHMLIEQAEQQAAIIRQEADMYYEAVQQQIAEQQAQWQEERQQWIEQARQEGYAQGFEQGKQDGFQQYMQLINEAKKIVQTANEQFYHMLESANETMLLIGFKVAERIMRMRLEEEKEHFLPLVRQVIQEVREQQEVKIYVHPSYYDVVFRQKEELKSLFSQDVHLFIYPDESLPESGCVVESAFGRIDASVDTQLEQLKKQLLERLEAEDA